ncbi:hypothetical protein HMPREF0308_1555 [Corynebacterium striatum ATCC 6940]|nr:hypothetical protein HMPREF0308_1555 [Corynebacterium striatum ATCC 6940]
MVIAHELRTLLKGQEGFRGNHNLSALSARNGSRASEYLHLMNSVE